MKRSIKTLSAGVVLAFGPYNVAMAGAFEDALAAYDKGDYAAAASYLLPLADRGDADSQSELGFLYEEGRGVPQDYARAAMWYRKAADQGNALAQSSLASAYANGQGVPKDDVQAVAWDRKAANQGAGPSQVGLGTAYADGRGVPQDYTQAYMWFTLAIDTASRDQAIEYGNQIVKRRDKLAAKMTPAQLTEAQRLASEWAPKK